MVCGVIDETYSVMFSMLVQASCWMLKAVNVKVPILTKVTPSEFTEQEKFLLLDLINKYRTSSADARANEVRGHIPKVGGGGGGGTGH